MKKGPTSTQEMVDAIFDMFKTLDASLVEIRSTQSDDNKIFNGLYKFLEQGKDFENLKKIHQKIKTKDAGMGIHTRHVDELTSMTENQLKAKFDEMVGKINSALDSLQKANSKGNGAEFIQAGKQFIESFSEYQDFMIKIAHAADIADDRLLGVSPIVRYNMKANELLPQIQKHQDSPSQKVKSAVMKPIRPLLKNIEKLVNRKKEKVSKKEPLGELQLKEAKSFLPEFTAVENASHSQESKTKAEASSTKKGIKKIIGKFKH